MLAADLLGDERVLRGVHPDVVEWTPQQGKEELLEALGRAYTRPYAAKWSVVMLLDLDSAQEGTIGAMLKTLEEPGQTTIFLLTAEVVPDVVASRCFKVLFHPRGFQERKDVLTALGVDAAERRAHLFPTVREAMAGSVTARAEALQAAQTTLAGAATAGTAEFLAGLEAAANDLPTYLAAATMLDGRVPVVLAAVRAGQMVADGVHPRSAATHLLRAARKAS